VRTQLLRWLAVAMMVLAVRFGLLVGLVLVRFSGGCPMKLVRLLLLLRLLPLVSKCGWERCLALRRVRGIVWKEGAGFGT